MKTKFFSFINTKNNDYKSNQYEKKNDRVNHNPIMD